MSEWFKRAFGEEYLELYAHRDLAEAERVVDLVLTHAEVPEGGLVLDVPCGAGRHLQAFQQRGYRALGFDLSLPLLQEAREGMVAEGTVVRGDLRRVPLKRGRADLVVNLFSSLGYFSTDEQNLAVLKMLTELARPKGWVAVDFMHSDFVQRNLIAESERTLESGVVVRDRRWIEGEPARVNKRTTLQRPDGREDVLEESVRMFSPEELRVGLEECGVMVEKEFGGYGGEAFCEDSKRIILIGRRR